MAQTRAVGLEHLCTFRLGDYMQIPPDDGPYDAVYAIEATCHAPDKARLFAGLARVMRPGALFGGYEWCVTPRYDPGNPEHRAIKLGIEAGDALPDIVPFAAVLDALEKGGFQVLEHRDLAPESDPETPWYEPLAGRWSISGFRHTRAGRTATNLAVRVLETARIAPRGSAAVSTLLNRAAEALVRGGQSGIFTPMFYFLARKP